MERKLAAGELKLTDDGQKFFFFDTGTLQKMSGCPPVIGFEYIHI
jgi:hypothetical protein